MRAFENMVLGKIFGAERGQITGNWKRFRNEKLYDLYL
jgi:hypothetical protein